MRNGAPVSASGRDQLVRDGHIGDPAADLLLDELGHGAVDRRVEQQVVERAVQGQAAHRVVLLVHLASGLVVHRQRGLVVERGGEAEERRAGALPGIAWMAEDPVPMTATRRPVRSGST
jgi:hypothetical protein